MTSFYNLIEAQPLYYQKLNFSQRLYLYQFQFHWNYWYPQYFSLVSGFTAFPSLTWWHFEVYLCKWGLSCVDIQFCLMYAAKHLFKDHSNNDFLFPLLSALLCLQLSSSYPAPWRLVCLATGLPHLRRPCPACTNSLLLSGSCWSFFRGTATETYLTLILILP